ncbi:hypothetical protein D3C85_1070950 [compost metagenome]
MRQFGSSQKKFPAIPEWRNERAMIGEISWIIKFSSAQSIEFWRALTRPSISPAKAFPITPTKTPVYGCAVRQAIGRGVSGWACCGWPRGIPKSCATMSKRGSGPSAWGHAPHPNRCSRVFSSGTAPSWAPNCCTMKRRAICRWQARVVCSTCTTHRRS